MTTLPAPLQNRMAASGALKCWGTTVSGVGQNDAMVVPDNPSDTVIVVVRWCICKHSSPKLPKLHKLPILPKPKRSAVCNASSVHCLDHLFAVIVSGSSAFVSNASNASNVSNVSNGLGFRTGRFSKKTGGSCSFIDPLVFES